MMKIYCKTVITCRRQPRKSKCTQKRTKHLLDAADARSDGLWFQWQLLNLGGSDRAHSYALTWPDEIWNGGHPNNTSTHPRWEIHPLVNVSRNPTMILIEGLIQNHRDISFRLTQQNIYSFDNRQITHPHTHDIPNSNWFSLFLFSLYFIMVRFLYSNKGLLWHWQGCHEMCVIMAHGNLYK